MPARLGYPARESNGDTLTTTNFDTLPGGWIGYNELTSNSGLTGITSITDLTGLSIAVTVNTSRRIRVTGSLGYTLSSTSGSGARIKAYIREGGTTLKTFANDTHAPGEEAQAEGSVVLTPSSGSHTYNLSLSIVVISGWAGTVDLTCTATDPGPAFILVEDIGAA